MAETFMPVPTYYKDPGVGWICHIGMFHPSTVSRSRCQDWNCYSSLNKWCKNSGCINATAASLPCCSLLGLCMQGCAGLEGCTHTSFDCRYWNLIVRVKEGPFRRIAQTENSFLCQWHSSSVCMPQIRFLSPQIYQILSDAYVSFECEEALMITLLMFSIH